MRLIEILKRFYVSPPESASLCSTESAAASTAPVVIPLYLETTYWWAYLHPNAVRLFERQWLVNLILWGNFAKLRDAALQEMGDVIEGDVLQVACVYGDFTEHVVRRLSPSAHLDVIDVAPIQIQNLQTKLKNQRQVTMLQQDATALQFADGSKDAVVVFFLLHEQPAEVRRKTISEALRVTKLGGKLIFVDYHRPVARNPFRYLMVPILRTLEPYAMDLWRDDIVNWLPAGVSLAKLDKQTYFGGLYQKVVITR